VAGEARRRRLAKRVPKLSAACGGYSEAEEAPETERCKRQRSSAAIEGVGVANDSEQCDD